MFDDRELLLIVYSETQNTREKFTVRKLNEKCYICIMTSPSIWYTQQTQGILGWKESYWTTEGREDLAEKAFIGIQF